MREAPCMTKRTWTAERVKEKVASKRKSPAPMPMEYTADRTPKKRKTPIKRVGLVKNRQRA